MINVIVNKLEVKSVILFDFALMCLFFCFFIGQNSRRLFIEFYFSVSGCYFLKLTYNLQETSKPDDMAWTVPFDYKQLHILGYNETNQ